jgi:hypothetical protein
MDVKGGESVAAAAKRGGRLLRGELVFKRQSRGEVAESASPAGVRRKSVVTTA